MKKMLLLLILTLLFNVSAKEKAIDLKQMKLKPGMTLDAGVLTMKGELEKYQKAIIKIPVSELPGQSFYVVAHIKSENVKQGQCHYMRPKLKVYVNDKPDTRVASLLSEGSLVDWTEHSLKYKLPPVRNDEQLVIELSMENCQGKVQWKDLKLTTRKPENVQRFPFAVPEKPVCKLDIDTAKAKPFNNNLLGLNSHFMGFNKVLSYSDKRVQDTLKKIKVPLMRFPGGTVANWYNYETDMWEVVPETDTSYKLMKRLAEAISSKRKFGFDEYLALSKDIGFNSTLVLNALHDSPERCVARVQDRKKRGLTFSWLELGNENYAKSQQSASIKDVHKYIEKCKEISKALKKEVPDTPIALNIHAPDESHWSIPISKETFYDAIVMHPYSHAGMGSAVCTPITIQEGVCAFDQLDKKFVLYKKHFGNKPLLLTEWGVMGSSKTIRNHLATLGTADMFFRILEEAEEGPVKMACLHVFSDGYMGLYDANAKTGQYYKRGYGVLYDLWRQAFVDKEVFSGKSRSPMLVNNQHAIMARATKDKDGKIRVYAVNLLPVNSTLDLSLDGKPFTGNYSIESFTEKDLFKQKKYAADENPCLKNTGNGSVILPPYSVSVATLQ